eukprot:9370647-Heterocapsa_arctica.AAC.1
MVGVIAEGYDNRQGNKEMFKEIVSLGPGLFDTIGPRQADEYGNAPEAVQPKIEAYGWDEYHPA